MPACSDFPLYLYYLFTLLNSSMLGQQFRLSPSETEELAYLKHTTSTDANISPTEKLTYLITQLLLMLLLLHKIPQLHNTYYILLVLELVISGVFS